MDVPGFCGHGTKSVQKNHTKYLCVLCAFFADCMSLLIQQQKNRCSSNNCNSSNPSWGSPDGAAQFCGTIFTHQFNFFMLVLFFVLFLCSSKWVKHSSMCNSSKQLFAYCSKCIHFWEFFVVLLFFWSARKSFSCF